MVIKLHVCLCFCILTKFAAAESKYPVSNIPAALMEGVNAVVREDVMHTRITAKDRATSSIRFVVTIFKSNGDDFASRSFSYDKLTRISDIKAAVYDAHGMLLKRLKSSEIYDRSAYDGSLFSDNRIKSVDLKQSSYPYTVEYQYEVEHKYLYSFMNNVMIPDEKVSVQYFFYQLTYPPDLALRYQLRNTDQKPVIEKNKDGTESMRWELKELMPVKVDPFGPAFREIVPQILAAPTFFEYEGYAGNMRTWKEYGQWQSQLNKDRDVLPVATKHKVRELTDGLAMREQKIKVLYEYLQGKTRYVSIQLGIGGLQPFEAAVVDQNGYGDCKALSNYMVALLKEAGIKGYFATIMAGRDAPDVTVDFPSHQANHAIVAVPNERDTIWLECTSQTNPFGYLGHFTGDRYALMITEEGGKLARTTRYPQEKNIQSTTADVFLEINGNAKSKARSSYSGLQYENGNLDAYLASSKEDQKKWIQKNTDIPSFDVGQFTMTNHKGRIPSAIVEVDLVLNRYASASGKRLFLTPNLLNRLTYVPEKVENRKTSVNIDMGYVDYDTIRYHIPESIYPEFLPLSFKFASRFGNYEAGFKLDQGKLIYSRRININKGEFPPDSYQELIDFYRKINKADNTKIVFLTKT